MCSVTLTFMNWHNLSDLVDGSTLAEVQRAARRAVQECGKQGTRHEFMNVGLTRVGVNGRLLVVVGNGNDIPRRPGLSLGGGNGTGDWGEMSSR